MPTVIPTPLALRADTGARPLRRIAGDELRSRTAVLSRRPPLQPQRWRR